jgi:hypothetical protein
MWPWHCGSCLTRISFVVLFVNAGIELTLAASGAHDVHERNGVARSK